MGDRSVAGRAAQEATYYEEDREILRENAAHGCLTKFMYLEKLWGNSLDRRCQKGCFSFFPPLLSHFVSP